VIIFKEKERLQSLFTRKIDNIKSKGPQERVFQKALGSFARDGCMVRVAGIRAKFAIA